MLVQFSFRNVLSFAEETTLDLRAVEDCEDHTYNLIDGGDESYLKVAAVYGANASGKSNLWNAFAYFRDIVMKSMDAPSQDEMTILEKNHFPYRYVEQEDQNSTFSIVLQDKKREYRYGFTYNDKKILEEHLYAGMIGDEELSAIFERDAVSGVIDFDMSVKDVCDAYKGQIPDEALFLTFFARLRNFPASFFLDLYEEINDIMVLNAEHIDMMWHKDSNIRKVLAKLLEDKKERERMLRFLKAIDVDIKNLEVEVSKSGVEIYTIHVNNEGNSYVLALDNESEGTIRCIALYIFLEKLFLTGGTLIFDELNTAFHPLLMKFFVNLFHKSRSRAQLIYTTHDTTWMQPMYFRQDQIYLVQKDEERSYLISLADFEQPLRAKDDLLESYELNYLAGVYGGIPSLGEFSFED